MPKFPVNLANDRYDAVVVGSGPNGLSAAIRIAQEGCSVLVVEAAEDPGGGARTAERTLPGFRHDICSAVHPMGVASPFLKTLRLEEHGLQWIHPQVPLAHPLDGGDAMAMLRSVEETADLIGGRDGRTYRRMFEPFVDGAESLFRQLLGPLRVPRIPWLMSRFGIDALRPSTWLARSRFRGDPARALFAGNAAHSVMPLDAACTSAIGMMLGISGHAVGWPVAKGGSASITAALVAQLESLGGELACGWHVRSIRELPPAKAYLFDTAPRLLAEIAGDRLPAGYVRRLSKFKHGPGVFKVDWALSEPIPWQAELARKAGTVHVGGSFDEIVAAEKESCGGSRPSERPFVLVAQPTLSDPTRAPKGKHVAWGYCHVPSGSTEDQTAAIEAQIERFAPGFRDVVIGRAVMTCSDYQAYNPNLIGGDVAGGMNHWTQLFSRPVARLNPYTTPERDIYICSSSTPPGGGVHGMCGFWAAEAALRRAKLI